MNMDRKLFVCDVTMWKNLVDVIEGDDGGQFIIRANDYVQIDVLEFGGNIWTTLTRS